MMRGFGCAIVLLLGGETVAAQQFTAEVPAAPGVKVVVTGNSTAEGVTCTLSRVADQAESRQLWEIGPKDSSPLNWFNLISADEKNGELAVLAESGMGELRVLRFKVQEGELLGDTRLQAPGLILRKQVEKGLLQIQVPDRIEWKNDAGLVRTFVMEGERLRGVGDVGFDPSSPGGGYPGEPGRQTGGTARDEVPIETSGVVPDSAPSPLPLPPESSRAPDEGSRSGAWVWGIGAALLVLVAALFLALKRR